MRTRKLIRDSKTLSREQRQKVIPTIHDIALDANVAMADVDEIEKFGIVGASHIAMRRAIALCKFSYSILLVDGRDKIKNFFDIEQVTVIDGDDLCFSVAAASIIAKEARDEYMRKTAKLFPYYGFERNVGYGTKEHQKHLAINGTGPLVS